MRSHLFVVATVVLGTMLPATAHAAAVQLPDPADFSLFALGITGLIIGRWAAGKKPRD